MSDQGDYWSDYNRGAAGLPPRNGMYRTWGEQAGHASSFGYNNNNNNNGGGGGALILLVGALVAIVAIAAAAAVSALLALPAAYLLIAVTARFTGGHALPFNEAYKTSFIGLVIASVIGSAFVLLMTQGVLPGLLPVAMVIWVIVDAVDVTTLSPAELTNTAIGALILMAPGMIAFAIVLRRRIGDPYAGGAGFLRGIAASIAVLLLPMLAFGAAAWFVATYGEIAIRSSEITTYLAVSFALVAIMAIAGGLLLGLALMAFGGGLTRGGPMFRTAWLTGAIAMAISGGTAALAILFFRDGDGMLGALIAATGAGSTSPPPFNAAAPGFLKLVLPGALAGAAFVAGSLYAYRGLFGWIKAFLITVPVTLAGLAGAIMALAQLL
ncbi:MAG: hypothetical protein QM698_09755 [Micropepsaceae bacterium]